MHLQVTIYDIDNYMTLRCFYCDPQQDIMLQKGVKTNRPHRPRDFRSLCVVVKLKFCTSEIFTVLYI